MTRHLRGSLFADKGYISQNLFKIIILDNRWVLTGSFNFTRAANSKNAENLLLINDPSLAQIYKKNWEGRVERAKQTFM
ncbi:MAG: hypothetical protein K2X28_06125 [Alphaproteobacteria bacterium]|nr:hypothetical protein [Alphaproteobacteria bacterium]